MSAVYVAAGPIRGTVVAPPSKSFTHRAVVAAALSNREYRITNPLIAEDTLATARGAEALGYSVEQRPGRWTVRPRDPHAVRRVARRIACGRSGTTLRFLSVLAARDEERTRFVGDAQLVRRPMRPLLAALRTGGVEVHAARTPSGLPFEVEGPLRAMKTTLRTDESSQFLSALLLVLPTVPGNSRVRFLGSPVSWNYVRATAQVLRAHRIRFGLDRKHASVPGGQTYRGRAFLVPGDASSAAYLWSAAAVSGGRVRVRGIDLHWTQADLAILPMLRRVGATVQLHSDGATVEGRGLRPLNVDLTDSPDLYPLVAVLAALAPGRSRVRGAAHVVHKESDRRAAAVDLVRAFGGRSRVTGGTLVIDGAARPRPLRLTVSSDHRVVMAAAVGALASKARSRVGHVEAVAKSYPEFWNAFRDIGAHVGRVR